MFFPVLRAQGIFLELLVCRNYLSRIFLQHMRHFDKLSAAEPLFIFSAHNLFDATYTEPKPLSAGPLANIMPSKGHGQAPGSS